VAVLFENSIQMYRTAGSLTLAIDGVGEPGSSVVTTTELRAGRSEIESRWGQDFSARPYRLWGPPSLL